MITENNEKSNKAGFSISKTLFPQKISIEVIMGKK